jgi:integrase
MSFFYRTRGGRQRWHTIGRHGAPWTPELARNEAIKILGRVAEGEDPAADKQRKRRAATVSELCDFYLADAEAGRTRVVRFLGAVFSYAIMHKMRGDNPVRGVTQFEDGQKRRRLSGQEYRALGAALANIEKTGLWPAAVAATRFVALSGWRSGEALGLRWGDIDLEHRTVFLPDTKTGKSLRPLSNAAIAVLQNQYRLGELVFPATRGNGGLIMSGYKRFFRKIAEAGKLPRDITPNTFTAFVRERRRRSTPGRRRTQRCDHWSAHRSQRAHNYVFALYSRRRRCFACGC